MDRGWAQAQAAQAGEVWVEGEGELVVQVVWEQAAPVLNMVWEMDATSLVAVQEQEKAAPEVPVVEMEDLVVTEVSVAQEEVEMVAQVEQVAPVVVGVEEPAQAENHQPVVHWRQMMQLSFHPQVAAACPTLKPPAKAVTVHEPLSQGREGQRRLIALPVLE